MTMSASGRRPLLIVICGPSGAGKSTLCEWLRRRYLDLVYSISCTTRSPRGSEQDGREYYFLSEEEFMCRVAEGLFLEHAVVHGHRYGTLRTAVLEPMQAGQSVLMDIDVQGARQVRRTLADLPAGHVMKAGFVDILILPPSPEALRQRLITRAEDSAEALAVRLRNAEAEMAAAAEFRYIVVNDNLERAFDELDGILTREWALPLPYAQTRLPRLEGKEP